MLEPVTRTPEMTLGRTPHDPRGGTMDSDSRFNDSAPTAQQEEGSDGEAQ